jgi:carboxymethylenebutenolidase
VNESTVSIPVAADQMRCQVWTPAAGREFFSGVVLLSGGYGLDKGGVRLAKRLALTGYTVIAPDFFHRTPDTVTDPFARIRTLSWPDAKCDVEAAIAYLHGSCGVPDRVAAVGFCIGGALALVGPVPMEAAQQLRVPIIGHFGELDNNPTLGDMAEIEKILEHAGTESQLFAYKGAVHGFAGANPQRYNMVAANTAYDRSVGWIDRMLRPTRLSA